LSFKAHCSYHKYGFANLSKEQQEMILSTHDCIMP
jgi:hypothetical protein